MCVCVSVCVCVWGGGGMWGGMGGGMGGNGGGSMDWAGVGELFTTIATRFLTKKISS